MKTLYYATMQPMMDIDGGGGAVTSTTTVNTANVDISSTVQPSEPVAAPISAMEFEIEGIGKVKADEIKEWKLGYMRQSDYTKKTQEIAKQRNETKDAIEVYNYLKNNPAIAQSLADGDTSVLANSPIGNKVFGSNPQLEDVNYRLASIELDAKLNTLKSKYPDFNEVDVLTEADRLGVADLEFVYNALRGKQVDSIKESLAKQIEAELTAKIRKNGIDTQTIIDPTDTVATVNHGLTPEQLTIAAKMKLTPEQYARGLK